MMKNYFWKNKLYDIIKKIEGLKGMMNTAASQLDFETAITLREEIAKLKRKLNGKGSKK